MLLANSYNDHVASYNHLYVAIALTCEVSYIAMEKLLIINANY